MYNPANGYLRTSGRWIVDGNGNRFKLSGVNWAGAHEDNLVPGGLDYVSAASIASQLVSWGFNSVRFPFAGQTITSTTPINLAYFNSANQTAFASWLTATSQPSNTPMTPWNVYQYCVYELTQAGLIVIPNYHLLYKGWCCASDDTNGLWYNSNNSQTSYINNWMTVVNALHTNTLVVGYDLKNEPRQANIGGKWYYPSWGNGNTHTDMNWFYAYLSTFIQAVHPTALMICEQVASYNGTDRPTLGTILNHPVNTLTANTVVYSNHQYPFGITGKYRMTQSNFNIGLLQGASGWGAMVADTNQAVPVWMGELGMLNTSTALLGVGTPGSQSAAGEYPGAGGGNVGARLWWQMMQGFHQHYDPDWCWWHLSGTHVQGTTPSTNELQYALGDHAWDGLYSASWNGVSNPTLLSQLQALQAPNQGPGTPYH